MIGPILPGESLADIRAIRAQRPTLALLPGESPALADLARLSHLQGVDDADSPDCDLDPFC